MTLGVRKVMSMRLLKRWLKSILRVLLVGKRQPKSLFPRPALSSSEVPVGPKMVTAQTNPEITCLECGEVLAVSKTEVTQCGCPYPQRVGTCGPYIRIYGPQARWTESGDGSGPVRPEQEIW